MTDASDSPSSASSFHRSGDPHWYSEAKMHSYASNFDSMSFIKMVFLKLHPHILTPTLTYTDTDAHIERNIKCLISTLCLHLWRFFYCFRESAVRPRLKCLNAPAASFAFSQFCSWSKSHYNHIYLFNNSSELFNIIHSLGSYLQTQKYRAPNYFVLDNICHCLNICQKRKDKVFISHF